MGNIGTTIKRFLSNKNTVTLIAIILCTIILYFFYNNRVNNAVSKTWVCYAKETIPARKKITKEMVSSTEVLTSQVSDNMIKTCDQVIGKYASYATEIPENSYFYTISVMEKEEFPDSAFDDIPDGYNIYSLPVNFQSTYGNSVFPEDYIDLYLSTNDEAGLPIYGKFIQSIKVHAVKDSNGKNVFETTVESRMPSQLLFSVPEDLFLLLKKAEILGIKIELVPKNNNYSALAGSTLVSSDYLKELIINQTGVIPDECVTDETGTAECKIAEKDTTTNDQNVNNQPTTDPNTTVTQ